jgi:hypothetical protein
MTTTDEATLRRIAREHAYVTRRVRTRDGGEPRYTVYGHRNPDTGGVLKGSGRPLVAVPLEEVARFFCSATRPAISRPRRISPRTSA